MRRVLKLNILIAVKDVEFGENFHCKCDIQFLIVIKEVTTGKIDCFRGVTFSSELRSRLELAMDPWVILPMERERHSQQFLSCGPTEGFITGTQVSVKMFYKCGQ